MNCGPVRLFKGPLLILWNLGLQSHYHPGLHRRFVVVAAANLHFPAIVKDLEEDLHRRSANHSLHHRCRGFQNLYQPASSSVRV